MFIGTNLSQDESTLFSPSHGLLAHINQSRFSLTIGEIADGGNSLVSIVLGQLTGLFHAVTLVDEFTGLVINC